MLVLTGDVVDVIERKTKTGRDYKAVKIQYGGGGKLLHVFVNDFRGVPVLPGIEIKIPVSVQAYSSESGPKWSLTAWPSQPSVPLVAGKYK